MFLPSAGVVGDKSGSSVFEEMLQTDSASPLCHCSCIKHNLVYSAGQYKKNVLTDSCNPFLQTGFSHGNIPVFK